MAGHDVRKSLRGARAQIGFCPQHNVLFHELTVREHLQFFARLKGLTGEEMRAEIDSLIEKLELTDKVTVFFVRLWNSLRIQVVEQNKIVFFGGCCLESRGK